MSSARRFQRIRIMARATGAGWPGRSLPIFSR